MNAETYERIQAALRRLAAVASEMKTEGLPSVPQMDRVVATLAQMRANHDLVPAPSQIDEVEPTPPPINLPGDLQARWDSWEAFFTAICEFFGWPNNDQYLVYAQIAAILAQRGSVLADTLPTNNPIFTGTLEGDNIAISGNLSVGSGTSNINLNGPTIIDNTSGTGTTFEVLNNGLAGIVVNADGTIYLDWKNSPTTSQPALTVNTTGDVLLDHDATFPLGAVTLEQLQKYLPLSGGTLTGPLLLANDATQPLGAVTLEQMQAAIAAYAGPWFTITTAMLSTKNVTWISTTLMCRNFGPFLQLTGQLQAASAIPPNLQSTIINDFTAIGFPGIVPYGALHRFVVVAFGGSATSDYATIQYNFPGLTVTPGPSNATGQTSFNLDLLIPTGADFPQ